MMRFPKRPIFPRVIPSLSFPRGLTYLSLTWRVIRRLLRRFLWTLRLLRLRWLLLCLLKRRCRIPPLFSEGDGAELRRRFKRPRETFGSTSTSILEGLVHADPCSDVPLKRVPAEVREIMARYARPAVMGEDPSAHVRSMIGPAAARDNIFRGGPSVQSPWGGGEEPYSDG